MVWYVRHSSVPIVKPTQIVQKETFASVAFVKRAIAEKPLIAKPKDKFARTTHVQNVLQTESVPRGNSVFPASVKLVVERHLIVRQARSVKATNVPLAPMTKNAPQANCVYLVPVKWVVEVRQIVKRVKSVKAISVLGVKHTPIVPKVLCV